MSSFFINNYDKKKTFSSFLPGIAGKKGTPMWCFYVNRGQAIGSFGIENKNNAIMEFFPANIMYQNIAANGFRTFIKCNSYVFEPFSESNIIDNVQRNMYIDMNGLVVEEINNSKGIKITVKYFTIPEEEFAALSRTVIVENISNEAIKLEIIDGLPNIIPYGIDNNEYKSVGNTLQSWMNIENIDNKIPFYKVRCSTVDCAQIVAVNKGNFYMSFIEDRQLVNPIVDKELIFGYNTSLSFPENFAKKNIAQLKKEKQSFYNKMSSAFTPASVNLKIGESTTINTLIGHISDIEVINNNVRRLSQKSYIEAKRKIAEQLIIDLTSNINTKTGNEKFDEYVSQNYLDNVLRGGYPLILGSKTKHVYHIYSRKHGDLERDYNFFSLSPEMYSQGNGNYRDVNQNRRNDVFFNPKVGNFNIKLFLNLIQLDGYNPLIVKGSKFRVKEGCYYKVIELLSLNEQCVFNLDCFTPGELVLFVRSNCKSKGINEDEVLDFVMNCSEQFIEAEFGEGFWIDHWTYNMDQINSYLNIFPEKKQWLLFEDVDYVYYQSPAKVKPRASKIISTSKGDRQYNSVEEIELQDRIKLLRDNFGRGKVFKTTLYVKLLNLALIKFSSMDIEGIGIEMEAEKPGWNDSLNGLPGLFGSGVGETLELIRLLDFMLSCDRGVEVSIPVEIYDLLVSVYNCLEDYNNCLDDNKKFVYWDRVATLREQFREQTYIGISGKMNNINIKDINIILEEFKVKIQKGIDRALELGNGLMPTYFRYDIQTHKEQNTMEVLGHRSNTLPYFLEGPAKALKVLTSKSKAKELYNCIKKSNIYDKKLKMYKVCECLDREPYEIGRARAFTRGWLENESIFLHMSYKYLLSVLEAGLYDEFFSDLQTSLVPMMDSNIYGRSIFENSSFIASSANPDETQHGRGHIARLSGSTAEFIHMWIIMMVGHEPFRIINNELQLHLKPILPKSYFDENKQLSFRFLGKTKVVYINESGLDTWNNVHVGSIIIMNSLDVYEFREYVGEPYTSRIRNGEFDEIIVRLESGDE